MKLAGAGFLVDEDAQALLPLLGRRAERAESREDDTIVEEAWSKFRTLPADRVDKIGRILARLNEADEPQKMNLPGFQLHPLTGDMKGFWAISVSGNWRIIFRFEAGHARDVDLIDYH